MNTLTDETELVILAAEIADAVGFSFADDSSADESEHLNTDGAWEYHFETDPAWGFLAATDSPVTTTYPGWGAITLDPYQWYIFQENTLVETISPRNSQAQQTSVGHAALADNDRIDPDDHITRMCEVFRRERDVRRGTASSETSEADESTPDDSDDCPADESSVNDGNHRKQTLQ